VISDDDVVDDEPDATDLPTAPAGVAVAPARRGLALPVVLAALLVLTAVFAFVQLQRAADATDERDVLDAAADDRQAATLVAAQFAEAFFTYDFDDVEASTSAVFGLVTDEYREDFETENVPGLQDLFGDVALVSTGVADEVVVGEIDGDTARALARVDIDTHEQGVDRTLADLTLSIVLRRQADEWRVDEVRIVQAHPEGGDITADPTATTATSAPAETTATTAPTG
jgi:hypothetical protein